MKKLISLLVLMLVVLLAPHSSACTDPRPVGQIGWAPSPGYAGPVIIGLRAGDAGVAGTWTMPGGGGLSQSFIRWGNDTGIEASGHYWPSPQTFVNRVVSINLRNTVIGGGWSKVTMDINSRAGTIVIDGLPGIVGQSISAVGAGGAIHMIKGVEVLSYDQVSTLGALQIIGTRNGAQFSNLWLMPGHLLCTDPSAVLIRGRDSRVMVARSFFPEIERVTRQWWQS